MKSTVQGPTPLTPEEERQLTAILKNLKKLREQRTASPGVSIETTDHG